MVLTLSLPEGNTFRYRFISDTGIHSATYTSPGTLLTIFLRGKLIKFAFIINKLIKYYFVLNNQSLKSAHKCGLYGEMVCLAIMGRRR